MSTANLYPLVLIDVALFSVVNDTLRVLLVQRAQEPYAQHWALPGGILKPDIDTSLEDTAKRVLRSKVRVEIKHLEEIRTFSGSSRDPRGWSIAVLYSALLPYDQINALVNNKVEELTWADVTSPGHLLAFDHGEQLEVALTVLRNRVRVNRPVLPLHLMPESFTLTDLQKTCQAILGKEIDKAAFRRRIKDSPDLIELSGKMKRGSHTPAQLYKARDEFVFGA